MSDVVEYDFVCPECAQAIEVNASMRKALIDNGCVVCGAAVSKGSFSRSTNGSSRTGDDSTGTSRSGDGSR